MKTLSKGLPLLPRNSQLSFVPTPALQGFLTDVWPRQNKSMRGHNPKWFSVWRRCVIHWLWCSDRTQDKDYKPWITHTRTHTHTHTHTHCCIWPGSCHHSSPETSYVQRLYMSFFHIINMPSMMTASTDELKWNSTSRNLNAGLIFDHFSTSMADCLACRFGCFMLLVPGNLTRDYG